MRMDNQKSLRDKIDAFLSETEMGPKYFGKMACGNSEVVDRLRNGGRVWPETASAILLFIAERSEKKDRPPRDIAPQYGFSENGGAV